MNPTASCNRAWWSSLRRVAGPWRWLLAGCLAAAAWAAPAYRYTPDFVIRGWQTPEGLPENSATAIAQTPDGYLWVGTFGGLTRFDGTTFELITDPDAGLTPTVGVLALKVTADGRLWVSTDRGIFVFAQRRLLPAYGQAGWPAGEYVRSWTETPGGLVAATFNGDCLRFTGDAWQRLPGPTPTAGGFTVDCDPAGELWAMKETHVYRWRAGSWQQVALPEPRPIIRSLCRSRAGGVWLLSTNGLWRADGDRVWLERPGQAVTSDPWSTREDSQGRLWLASLLNGLDLFQPDGRVTRLTRTNGLTADSLRMAFEDREGNVWLGSSGGGLMRFRDRKFTMLVEDSGLTQLAVNQLRFDSVGRLVAATQGGGVHLHTTGRFEPLDPPRPINRFVFAHATAEEPAGTLWAAFDPGLFRRVGDEWEPVVAPQLKPRSVHNVFVDRGRRVWAACENGLAVWRGDRLDFIEAPQPRMVFLQLLDAPDQGLFAATTDRGLWHLDAGGRWEPVASNRLGSLGICALLPLGEAVWLAATDGSFARWKDGKLAAVPVPGVDASAPIMTFVDDALGNLWLGTRHGLLRLPLRDAEAVADGRQATVSARTYGAADGLTTLDFRRSHPPSSVRGPDGRLWFATGGGIIRFDPAATGRTLDPPVTAIRRLGFYAPTELRGSMTNRLLDDPPAQVTLPASSSLITFDFLGIDFAAPEQLRYRVRLVPEGGAEPPWQELAEQRASFPFLPWGRYRFQVTAARMGEPWNPAPVELRFEVESPWWRRPPVLFALLLGAGGSLGWGVWALFSLRTRAARRRLLEETRRLDERREAERQNRLLRELLDQSADSVFVFELPAGTLVDASTSVTRSLGHPRERWDSLNPAGLHLLPPGQTWPGLVTDLRLEPRKRFETELHRADGQRLPAEVDIRLSRWDGREFVLAIARDVTDRRAAADRQSSLESELREAQKLEAIGRLAGGIAHDFNNLLQIIRGFTDFVRTDPGMAAAERAESLAEVSRAAARAADLTRQLLAFSRRESVEMGRCNLVAVVAESVKMLRPLVGTHIEVRFDAPAAVPPILADPGQLNQVLLNLAANARDAMAEGGQITLRVRAVGRPVVPAETAPWALPGQWVELAVSDTGSGIPDDQRARIFEPFFTTKEGGKGTGLGLSVVYGVVQQHRALIEVESTPTTGTTFRLLFPVCAAPESGAEPAPAPEGGVARPGHFRILVVDDEDIILRLTERVLTQAGHRVTPATDGPSAVKAFAADAGGFDLVVLDVLMPGMTGWVVARELRRLRPTVPILFCSGYATEEVEREIAALRDARLLLKPFTPTQVLMEVQLLASQHRQAGRIA